MATKKKSSRAKKSSKRLPRKPATTKYKEILLKRRSLLTNDIRRMEEEASTSSRSFEEDGTYEREILFGLIESQEGAIREIDAALQRMKNGSFGICKECDKPIGSKRLLAIPASQMCLDCRTAYEKEIYR